MQVVQKRHKHDSGKPWPAYSPCSCAGACDAAAAPASSPRTSARSSAAARPPSAASASRAVTASPAAAPRPAPASQQVRRRRRGPLTTPPELQLDEMSHLGGSSYYAKRSGGLTAMMNMGLQST